MLGPPRTHTTNVTRCNLHYQLKLPHLRSTHPHPPASHPPARIPVYTMSASIFRVAARASRPTFVRSAAPVSAVRFPKSFSTTVRRSDEHHEESFEEFTARYGPIH